MQSIHSCGMSRDAALASLGDSRAAADEPFGVSPKRTCVILNCGLTRVYELVNAGELESYKDGASRKITMRSIRARIARLLAESNHAKSAETEPSGDRAARVKAAAEPTPSEGKATVELAPVGSTSEAVPPRGRSRTRRLSPAPDEPRAT